MYKLHYSNVVSGMKAIDGQLDEIMICGATEMETSMTGQLSYDKLRALAIDKRDVAQRVKQILVWYLFFG